MLFDIHVLGKTGTVFNMRAHGDIVFFVDTFQGSGPEVQALLKTTEDQALVLLFKTVWPTEQVAGGEWPAIVVIASVYECLSG